MRSHWLSLLFALGVPLAASAQTTLPTITGNFTGLPLTSRQFNLDRFEDEEPYILLEWTASFSTFGGSFQYEISYDRSVIGYDGDPSEIRVRLEERPNVGQTFGDVVNGMRYQIQIRPESIVCVATASVANPCSGEGLNSDVGRRKLVLTVFPSGNFTEQAPNVTLSWDFQFDTRRPDPPVVTRVEPGDQRLVVSWTPPAPTSDTSTFELVYWAATSSLGETPSREPDGRVTGIAPTQTRTSIDDLANEQAYLVAMQTVDPFGNKSAIGAPSSGAPTDVRDFYEYYREQNGSEDGGFCFVATAAYGDYDAPAVLVLRKLRDHVLARLPLGEAFIGAYYRHSPRLAAAIAASPDDRAWARAALWPAVIVALGVMLAPFAAIGWLGTRALRRRRSASALVVALALGAALAAPGVARAAESNRAKPGRGLGFGFEARGGPFLPRMATETGPEAEAFQPIFGEPSGDSFRVDPNPLYRLGVDVQLLRGFGTLGIGGTFGFMQFVGRGLFKNGGRSSDTSVFNLMPLELTAFYRFDLLEDRAGIPIIPFARGGLAYHVWWVTNGRGEIASVGPDGDGQLVARGGKLGLTASFGAALLLNFIEPNTSRSMYETTGVRGTYLFGQVDIVEVDGFGADGFDLSDLTWSVGLSFEL